MGEADGEESYGSSILVRLLGLDGCSSSLPLGLCCCCRLYHPSWGRAPCPPRLCHTCPCVPPVLYSALLAGLPTRVSKTDGIQARIQQNHSKGTCWQQETFDYPVNEDAAQLPVYFASLLLLPCLMPVHCEHYQELQHRCRSL